MKVAGADGEAEPTGEEAEVCAVLAAGEQAARHKAAAAPRAAILRGSVVRLTFQ